jgi:hypothetical protein
MFSHSRLLFLPLLALAIPACAGSHPETAEVQGTLLWHKKPLANVEIQFVPDSLQGTSGPRSTAVTDEQGRYFLLFDDDQPGAVVGKHRVLLIENDPVERGGKGRERVPSASTRKNAANHPTIAPEYAKIATTPLGRDVVSSNQKIDFDLP